MTSLLIRNARLVNEGREFDADLRVRHGRIDQIAGSLAGRPGEPALDARGAWLVPGMIDDQVHFREPGAPRKGTIATESRAAVAGGITSYMDMPNTAPPTLSLDALADKEQRAARHSVANYGFHFGVSLDNLDTIAALDPRRAAGVKVFMGASTGNLLVDDPAVLERLFAVCRLPLLAHCEATPRIRAREAQWTARHGAEIPPDQHPLIRDEAACFESSSLAVSLARRFGTRLHVLHITTARELALFAPGPIAGKQITAEACVHHLLFDDGDYARLGHLIKCNPAIKRRADRDALRAALVSGRIDVIGTDHAPHTRAEKARPYLDAPSGLPLVEHALPALFELVADGCVPLATLVDKTSHAVAARFSIEQRGYLREGYWADLALIERLAQPRAVRDAPVLARCGWTPFVDHAFRHAVRATLVSGQIAWLDGQLYDDCQGLPLRFAR
ncbi:dihydroorotase [Burkholderia sp. FERM BP-3421]|jgi:dihydroorotase|uniref:dihydroorotase n=1 Tax=Burkholderia sp. FERM BP-3421 TaxID=1494466 RepID=UPI00235E017C|nr:dihydroorotase [Burkholderia sp. FERM BP-3421]WDD96527.1 dihydroorotase [Burkholderia sp. FERM BP-3421]